MCAGNSKCFTSAALDDKAGRAELGFVGSFADRKCIFLDECSGDVVALVRAREMRYCPFVVFMDMILDGQHRRKGVIGGLAAMAPDEVVVFSSGGSFGVGRKSYARSIVDILGVSEALSVGYDAIEVVLQVVR
jgi:hypothetical protein